MTHFMYRDVWPCWTGSHIWGFNNGGSQIDALYRYTGHERLHSSGKVFLCARTINKGTNDASQHWLACKEDNKTFKRRLINHQRTVTLIPHMLTNLQRQWSKHLWTCPKCHNGTSKLITDSETTTPVILEYPSLYLSPSPPSLPPFSLPPSISNLKKKH